MPDFPQSSQTPNPSPLIPDLFHQQKHYIFRALEAYAFPRFLRAKAFANLSPAGSFWRLVLGLLILWGGFVLGFSLIFLDRQPRAVRVWVSHSQSKRIYRANCLLGLITILNIYQFPHFGLLFPFTPSSSISTV